MIVALNLPNYGQLGTREGILAIAAAAEELGYESVWTTDHILVPDSLPAGFFGNMLESLMTLSMIAARTERIGIGAGILVLPQRDPILAAKQAATLQHLSGGRLRLAVGVGYIPKEYEFLRAPFARRGSLLDEYLPAMRQLLESEHPHFHGGTIDFDDVYFSPRPEPRIPIYVAGSSPRSLRRAAALGDGWYALKQTPDQIAAGLATIREHGADREFLAARRDPDRRKRPGCRAGTRAPGNSSRGRPHGERLRPRRCRSARHRAGRHGPRRLPRPAPPLPTRRRSTAGRLTASVTDGAALPTVGRR